MCNKKNINKYISAGVRTNTIEGFIFDDEDIKFLQKVANGKISIKLAKKIFIHHIKKL